ncbi:MAG TPA: hypothetical protein VM940_11585 [Chthoniobacterales bacterium]|jgi:hypothetical protein|nr:hypothetical protein [Chthoniobacterales bacterium]
MRTTSFQNLKCLIHRIAGFLLVAASTLLFVCAVSLGVAQQPTVQFGPQQGVCQDNIAHVTLDVVDATRSFYPGGPVEPFIQVIQRPAGPGMAPYYIAAAPDPSGIHLLTIRSAIPGQQFWVARNSSLITISPVGQVTVLGPCQFAPQFLARFRPPIPVWPTQFVPVAAGFDGAAVATSPPAIINLPTATIPEGMYNLPPVRVAPTVAQQCLSTAAGDRTAFFKCVATGSLGKKEKLAFECATSSTTDKEKALCMLAANLTGEDQANLQTVRDCYKQHGDNLAAYPVCLATARVDPKLMDAVNCLQQSTAHGQQPDYWKIGVCALGPSVMGGLNPNAEAQIAIDCAVKSGGNPEVFVGCAGGQLVVSELEKCLTAGFGGNGCFGNGNSISRVYQEVVFLRSKLVGLQRRVSLEENFHFRLVRKAC